MEKLKPVVSKSSISSLKFQRKSDFDKFLNFIKKQTKELKGIEKPKDDRLKSILKTGAIGLGILGLGAFLGRGAKTDAAGSEGGFAIGRRNVPDSFVETPKVERPPRRPKQKFANKSFFKKFGAGKRTQSFRSGIEGFRTKARRTVENQRVTREISKVKNKPKTLARTESRMTSNVTQSDGFRSTGQGTRGTGFRYKSGSDARFESGSVDPANTEGEFKNRGKRKINKKFSSQPKVSQSIVDEVRRIEKTLNDRKLTPSKEARLLKRLEQIRVQQGGQITGNFESTRPGVTNYSRPDPKGRFNVAGGEEMISTNKYKQGPISRGIVNRVSKMFGRNPKITRDTFLNIPTKGKFFTKAGMFFKHPIISGISFLLTGYEAIQEGRSIVNFKDNLFTNIYDLGVAINNELIHPNDPSQMKLYFSESDNSKVRARQIIRNQKILELKKQQLLQQSGKNKVVVVPTNNQTEGVKTTVPVPTSNNEVVIPPTKPLNIGENILLKKLDR